MSHESSLLIDDWVLPNDGASLVGASEDILMMMLVSGMERSEAQWTNLLHSVGLEVRKIWRSEGVHESVIEAKLRV